MAVEVIEPDLRGAAMHSTVRAKAHQAVNMLVSRAASAREVLDILNCISQQ